MPSWSIDPGTAVKDLGDLFGLFFEDLNHAADGGLYAELVQNRSFEFEPIDNPDYHALTAWRAIGSASVSVQDASPLHPRNPHYARVAARGAGEGIENLGFGKGMCLGAGKVYRFSCFARSDTPVTLDVTLGGARATLCVLGPWKQYRLELTTTTDTTQGTLALTLAQPGEVDVDMVSVFPADTFMGRENGLRRDLAETLADMRPRFLRFPGGCLVHDGSLDPDARDSMYRWKNTIGPVHERPSRRSGWRYNQTLGLGFYEYFLLCEDIGAKPLPIVSGGCDPHHKRFAPLDALQPWIDDALDLIEFANGPVSSAWGAVRARLGHPAPFGLEYIGIGNEEVGAPFFERLPFFVEAIRARYPDIRIIGTSGPFAAGGEYARGWDSAQALGIDIVDEHYYQAPEWYLANMDRYLRYPADGPRVFLGEYASWGNQYENALVEAAYMVQMQNAPAVALACYAPLFCHVDYVNWRPDMIWFDGGRVLKTANYHVQSLFMRHQGDMLLQSEITGLDVPAPGTAPPIAGGLSLGVNDITARFGDIRVWADGVQTRFDGGMLCGQAEKPLCTVTASAYALECTVERLEGIKGVRVTFGIQDEQNRVIWGVGGWENQDSLIDLRVRGRGSCLTQSEFSMRDGHPYRLRLEVDGRRIRTYIDGALQNDTRYDLPSNRPLYLTASRESESGDLLLKGVNLSEGPITVDIALQSAQARWDATAHTLEGIALDAENTFDAPDRVAPTEKCFTLESSRFPYTFAPRSVVALRLKAM